MTESDKILTELTSALNQLSGEIKALRVELKPEIEELEVIRSKRKFALEVASAATDFTDGLAANLLAQEFTPRETQPKLKDQNGEYSNNRS
jgi:hypothetical protein